eukprot:scaffold236635_cov19-Prasinocladus_malaysianus.AAC.1
MDMRSMCTADLATAGGSHWTASSASFAPQYGRQLHAHGECGLHHLVNYAACVQQKMYDSWLSSYDVMTYISHFGVAWQLRYSLPTAVTASSP